jgi:hypothetical protein
VLIMENNGNNRETGRHDCRDADCQISPTTCSPESRPALSY